MKIDRQLQKDVMDELEFDPSVVAEHIAVSVSDGIVTLKGHVPSYAEKYAAEKAAFRVAGVKAVVEEIEVQLPGMKLRRDEEIAKAAADALLWNVLVPSSVQVTVENSLVILRCDVYWSYQI
ncbi:MAG: BON domain-containing protein [Proteobacteria bacterium]|nr:BON domain-containing protein [Pseudomonadota bacterium]